eukprot:6359589-Karenia_brevis.AAC.1
MLGSSWYNCYPEQEGQGPVEPGGPGGPKGPGRAAEPRAPGPVRTSHMFYQRRGWWTYVAFV